MASQSGSGKQDVRDFLVTRRAKISPEQAGLSVYGSNRRVPGLRREEVAMLAGVSVDYYTRLEKGNLAGASDSVLDAIAAAMQLSEAERTYLFDLARAANSHTPRRPLSRARTVRPTIQRMLDSMTDAAAFVRNGRLDILGSNLLARSLYSPIYDSPTRPSPGAPPNFARFHFLDPAAEDFFPDASGAASTCVQLLRAEVGRNPHDKALSDLVGELSTRSDDFRVRWGAHDVRTHRSGVKRFCHPDVGYLELEYESMALGEDAGLSMTVYLAEPGTPAADGLALLAAWGATHLRASAEQQLPARQS